MVVSSSPFQHMKGKPDVKYVANIHGNEAVSREMALHLIQVNLPSLSFSQNPKNNWIVFPAIWKNKQKQTAFSQELQGRRLHPLAAGPDANPHLAKSQSRRIRSGSRGHLHRWSRKVTRTHTRHPSSSSPPSIRLLRMHGWWWRFYSFLSPPETSWCDYIVYIHVYISIKETATATHTGCVCVCVRASKKTFARHRYNARGFDLNRNFPDYFKQNTKRLQPETEAYKEWIAKIQFTLSAGLHAGALVASYPFDNTPNSGRDTEPF